MPPDTIFLPGKSGPPPQVVDSFELVQQQLREAYQAHLDSATLVYQNKLEEEKKGMSSGEELTVFLIVFLIIATSAFFYIIKPAWEAKKKKKEKYRLNKDSRPETEARYDYWLSRYNPYYSSLSSDLKERFINRTSEFLLKKEFKFHSMVEEEHIPVLISGAAVQMTFGLKNYTMDYFPLIHVIRKEYTLHIDKETYYGHVSHNGIYISWSSFLEGYSDYTDSVNVGLHEMAHAVSYDLFLGETDLHDMRFKERLNDYTVEGSKIYRSMRSGNVHMFDDYGATNFDEFWAVTIETFFEKSAEFKQEHPELYTELCELLNQDPLSSQKIIDDQLAGI